MPNITSTLAVDILGLDAVNNLPVNLLTSVSADYDSNIFLTANVGLVAQNLIWLDGPSTHTQTAQIVYFRNLGANSIAVVLNYLGGGSHEFVLSNGGLLILFAGAYSGTQSQPVAPLPGFVGGTAKSITAPSNLEYYLAG